MPFMYLYYIHKCLKIIFNLLYRKKTSNFQYINVGNLYF